MLRDAYPSLIDEGDSALLQGLLTVCNAYANHLTSSTEISSSGVAQVAECYREYYRNSVSTTDAVLSVGIITTATESALPPGFTNNIKVRYLLYHYSSILMYLVFICSYLHFMLIFTHDTCDI